MRIKNKVFVIVSALSVLANCAYAKSGNDSSNDVGNNFGGRSSLCEQIKNKYEDLDCFDASETGAICEPGEDIISLPRRFQLCCCVRISDEANALEDIPEDPSSNVEFGFKKH